MNVSMIAHRHDYFANLLQIVQPTLTKVAVAVWLRASKAAVYGVGSIRWHLAAGGKHMEQKPHCKEFSKQVYVL